MLEYDEYNKHILNWISIFRNKLMTTKYECIPFYALNKDFFEFEERRGNSNKFILIGNNMINPDKSFFVLNNETWMKIKRGYPNEKELKVKGTFNNKKCVLEINNSIYYFYYIMNNNIQEGYFKFNNNKCKEDILSIFFDKDIHDFIYKFKIREINSTQTVYYEQGYFSIKIKDKNSKDNKTNNRIEKNNEYDEWNNNKEQNKMSINKNKYNNINDEYILNKNKGSLNTINNEQNGNPNIIKNNNEYQNSLKLYKCAYYYFHFEQFLKYKCKNVLNFESLNLYLIDKTWLSYFKDHCNYDKIIKHLSSNIENFNNTHNIFCDYFARKYPLNLKTFQHKPYPPKKNKITEKEYFLDNYDFIDEKMLNIFLEEFNVLNANKSFKSYEVIIKNDIFIIIYDIYNLEILSKNDRLLFSVGNSKDLSIIKDAFKFSDYKKALRDLNIIDINIPEQNIIDKMNVQIGKMRNLSLIINDNRFKNIISGNNFDKNNFKFEPMLNDYNYKNNNQNTLYQSYDKLPKNKNSFNINDNELINKKMGKSLEKSSQKKGYDSGKKLTNFYNFLDDGKDKQKNGNNNNINNLGETGYYEDENKEPNANEEMKRIQNNNIPINKIEDQKNKNNHLNEDNEVGNKLNNFYLKNKSSNPGRTFVDSDKKNENYIYENNMRRANIENTKLFINEFMGKEKNQKKINKNNNKNNINDNHRINNNNPNQNWKSLRNNYNINASKKNNVILNSNNSTKNNNNNEFIFNNNLRNMNIPAKNNETGFNNNNNNNLDKYNFRGNKSK